MDQKMMVSLGAAFVPLLIGAIWYNPYLLGKLWMRLGAISGKQMSGWVLLFTIVVAYIASFNIARQLVPITVHQRGLFSMLAGNPDVHTQGTELYNIVQGLMDKFGRNYRTFKHGALHGTITGIFFILPILVIIALVDRKKIAWILVHAIFWIMCLAIMGGIVCEYMP